MELKFEKKWRTLVVKLSGEIDHHTAEEIRRQTERELDRSMCSNLIFDYSNVTFMDSSGIGMIIGRFKLITGLGGKIAVCCVNETVNKIFLASGLYQLIPIFKTVQEAVSALEGRSPE